MWATNPCCGGSGRGMCQANDNGLGRRFTTPKPARYQLITHDDAILKFLQSHILIHRRSTTHSSQRDLTSSKENYVYDSLERFIRLADIERQTARVR